MVVCQTNGKKDGRDPRDPPNASNDNDNDRYTNIEEYLNGTDPTGYVDYTQPENNINTLKERAFM